MAEIKSLLGLVPLCCLHWECFVNLTQGSCHVNIECTEERIHLLCLAMQGAFMVHGSCRFGERCRKRELHCGIVEKAVLRLSGRSSLFGISPFLLQRWLSTPVA